MNLQLDEKKVYELCGEYAKLKLRVEVMELQQKLKEPYAYLTNKDAKLVVTALKQYAEMVAGIRDDIYAEAVALAKRVEEGTQNE